MQLLTEHGFGDIVHPKLHSLVPHADPGQIQQLADAAIAKRERENVLIKVHPSEAAPTALAYGGRRVFANAPAAISSDNVGLVAILLPLEKSSTVS